MKYQCIVVYLYKVKCSLNFNLTMGSYFSEKKIIPSSPILTSDLEYNYSQLGIHRESAYIHLVSHQY